MTCQDLGSIDPQAGPFYINDSHHALRCGSFAPAEALSVYHTCLVSVSFNSLMRGKLLGHISPLLMDLPVLFIPRSRESPLQ